MERRLDYDWTEGQKRTREIYRRYLNDQEPKEHSRETIYRQPPKELWQLSNRQKRVKEQSWRTRAADRRTGIQGMLETRNPRERMKSQLETRILERTKSHKNEPGDYASESTQIEYASKKQANRLCQREQAKRRESRKSMQINYASKSTQIDYASRVKRKRGFRDS